MIIKYFKTVFTFFLLFATLIQNHAETFEPHRNPQPVSVTAAANNECTGAITLSFGIAVNDNNTGATQSLAPNICNGFASPNANDVWYNFTYTAQMDCVVVNPGSNPNSDVIVELFSGACGTLNFLACGNFAEPNSSIQTEGIALSTLGLTVGENYKLRVYGYNGVVASFSVLLKSGIPLPPPANDNCASPVTLTSGATAAGTSLGATQSIAPINCQGFTSSSAKDVWYKFTKSTLMDSLILYPFTAGVDFALEVRSNNCASGTTLLCSDQAGSSLIEKISLSALTNGTIYLARVYARNGASGEFSIRIKSGPANNNCTGATELLSGAGQQNGRTIDASQSLPPSTCLGASDDDVWFKFSMVAGLDTVKVTPVGLFNPVVELRSGTCVSSSAVRCSNNGSSGSIEKIFVGDLSEGNTYFIRVYSFGPGAGSEGSFQIQLMQTANLPENDECTAPVAISFGNVANGSNTNATQTIPAVSCGGSTSTIATDVWYSFTKTEQIDSVRFDGLGSLDLVIDIRANSCAGGALVACSNIEGTGQKNLDISNLTNGTTYLLRVFGWNGATGDFTLEFRDANVVVNPPANDDCFDATTLTTGITCVGVAGTNAGATESLPASTACSGINPGAANDVWYTFTANGTSCITRLICNTGFDGAIQVYSGSCFGLTSIGCADNLAASNDPDFPAIEEVFLTGLTSGQQYYLRIYGFNGATGSFAVCAFNPNCNSTPATLTTSLSGVVSNQAFSTQVAGGSGEVSYQYSSNQVLWSGFQATTGIVDTLVFTATTNSILYLRAVTRNGSCYPAYSNVVPVAIRCATPFTNSSGSDRINKITLGTINQTSTINPMGGNVEDFTSVSTSLCKGNTYPLGITVNSAVPSYNRMAWIDFNQDGDFADAGENVLFGTYSSGITTTHSITIPANATSGNCRMRIAIIDNNTGISSSDPCASGPYAYGEIEEYTVNITSVGLVSNAGPNQTICGTTATLAGNDPGAGNSGIWTVVSGTATFANASSFSTTVSGLSAGANILRWTLTNGCGSTPDDVTITTSAVSANAGSNQSVCAATATLGASNPATGAGAWSVLSGGATVTTPSNRNSGVTGLSVGVNTFIWTVTLTGCPVVKDTVLITRLAEPSAANAGNDQVLCATPVTISANTPTVGTGLWSVVNGNGTFSNPTNATTQVIGLTAGTNTFRWTISNGTCTPKTDDVVITLTTPPVANAGADQSVCAPNTTFNGNAPGAGETGTWTLLSGTGTIAASSQNNSGVSALGVGSNQFVWKISRTGCPDGKDTVQITRKQPPVANAGSNQTVCVASGNLSAQVPVSGTGLWTLVSGTGIIISPSQPNTSIAGLGIGTNTFRWTVTDAPCAAATSEVAISREANPVSLGKDTLVCSNITPTYLLSGPSGMTSYSWSSGQSTPQISVSAPADYILSVVTPGGCQFRDTVSVTFQICDFVSSAIVPGSFSAQIVPNPVIGNENARLLLNVEKPGYVHWTMFDMKGRRIGQPSVRFLNGKNDLTLPSGLSSGMYHITIGTNGTSRSLTWMVK